jgi:hypothetical protein
VADYFIVTSGPFEVIFEDLGKSICYYIFPGFERAGGAEANVGLGMYLSDRMFV